MACSHLDCACSLNESVTCYNTIIPKLISSDRYSPGQIEYEHKVTLEHVLGILDLQRNQ
jgi:hypothetical protein